MKAVRSGRLDELRNFGAASQQAVREVLEAAGFGVGHRHPLPAGTSR
ncbi:hypothetical protein [Actinomadura sp. CNU-125]|nr:hypothetical protein [Actinomadura sp. CNU-125]